MDYTQRHQAAMDAIRKDFDENEDEVLKVPNFSLMERFLVVGGKDPWLFFNNMWKIIYPANKKKSRNAIDDLRNDWFIWSYETQQYRRFKHQWKLVS